MLESIEDQTGPNMVLLKLLGNYSKKYLYNFKLRGKRNSRKAQWFTANQKRWQMERDVFRSDIDIHWLIQRSNKPYFVTWIITERMSRLYLCSGGKQIEWYWFKTIPFAANESKNCLSTFAWISLLPNIWKTLLSYVQKTYFVSFVLKEIKAFHKH